MGRRLYLDRNLQIVFGVTLIAVMAVSSVTPAFPKITRELGISDGQVGLLITVFTLPGVLLAPFLGVAADRFGRKRILVPALLLFAVSGTSLVFIQDWEILLVVRTIQGIGGAPLGALATTLIGDLYEGRERAAAMGLNASVLSVGTASYPAIGGALALLAWHYPFALAALALPVALLVLFSLDNPEPERTQGVRSYLVSAVAHFLNPRLIALFAAGVLTFIFIYGTYLTYFSLLLGRRFEASSFTIGLIFTSMSLTTALVSSQLGRISRVVPLGRLIIIAFAVYAVSMVMIPLIDTLWLFVLPAMLFGGANGINTPAIQTSVAALAPLEYRGALMSVNATIIRAGQTLGPPLVGLLWVNVGADAAFYGSAALAALAIMAALALRDRLRPG
ncbi:MAG: MFS transporter [Thermoleophilia bacterium]